MTDVANLQAARQAVAQDQAHRNATLENAVWEEIRASRARADAAASRQRWRGCEEELTDAIALQSIIQKSRYRLTPQDLSSP